jgi:hypothetical protein
VARVLESAALHLLALHCVAYILQIVTVRAASAREPTPLLTSMR